MVNLNVEMIAMSSFMPTHRLIKTSDALEIARKYAKEMCKDQRKKDIRFITNDLGYDMQSEERDEFLNQALATDNTNE